MQKTTATQPDPEDLKAYAALADAFATITEYSRYLPQSFAQSFDDEMNDWLNRAQWQNKPELIRVVAKTLIQERCEQQSQ